MCGWRLYIFFFHSFLVLLLSGNSNGRQAVLVVVHHLTNYERRPFFCSYFLLLWCWEGERRQQSERVFIDEWIHVRIIIASMEKEVGHIGTSLMVALPPRPRPPSFLLFFIIILSFCRSVVLSLSPLPGYRPSCCYSTVIFNWFQWYRAVFHSSYHIVPSEPMRRCLNDRSPFTADRTLSIYQPYLLLLLLLLENERLARRKQDSNQDQVSVGSVSSFASTIKKTTRECQNLEPAKTARQAFEFVLFRSFQLVSHYQ